MRTGLTAAALLTLLVAGYGAAARANGSNVPVKPSVRAGSAEARAIEAYNAGIAKRDRGQQLEAKAAAVSGAERVALEAAARREFEAALADFTRAAETFPDLFQAYNGIGYAWRKLGDYEKALENYDRAIDMAPGLYTEAMEYRGEAYLGLNRIDDAKKAYLDLLGSDRKQAALLLDAMKQWIAARRAEPKGVDPSALAAFEAWVAEREGIAAVTAGMAFDRPAQPW
jgi:tetratricopeptide (TPR) repeat protein